MPEIDLQRLNARRGLVGACCAAAGVGISLLPDLGQWDDRWGIARLTFGVLFLMGAAIYGIQIQRLGCMTEQGIDQGRVRSGESRRHWPVLIVLVIVLVSVSLLFVLFSLVDYDPNRIPWWVYALIALPLVVQIGVEMRRLTAMGRHSLKSPPDVQG